MNPSKFLGSKVGEDPQNFVDKVKKIIGVMQVTGTESVKRKFYQIKDAVHIWFTQWKDNMGLDTTHVTWDYLREFFYAGSSLGS